MNMLKSLISISMVTTFSRVLGFVRDSLIARIFGSGLETDAFFLAFKLPNLFRRIFAEGAFSQAFIPILTNYLNQKKDETTIRLFISRISGLLMLVLVIFSLIGVIVSPYMVKITAPGFNDTIYKCVLTTQLLRITFPYIFLVSLSSLSGAILNSWNCFLIPAFSPTILNAVIIFFSVFITSYFDPPVLALAWSVIIGGILQIAYQLPYLKKINMLTLPRINLFDLEVLRVLKQIGAITFSASASQISLIANTIFASFLVSSSISWIYYADRLIELPSGVLGVSLSTILLPSLSRRIADGKYDEYNSLIDWGLRLSLLLSLPSAVAIGILAEPLTVSLFQYGKFTSFDAMMTQKSLLAYSVGLVGIIIIKVITPVFYSIHNIKTPIKIAYITFFVAQLMNLIFIGPLKHVGLSLSVGLSSCLNAFLLYWKLRKSKIFTPQPGWTNFILRLSVAVLFMAFILLSTLHFMPEWSLGTMLSRLLRLIFVVFIGIIAYFFILVLLGFKMRNFRREIT